MVGQDVPVLTGSTVGSNNSNPFNTVERKKVGIMLKVTPQINEGNAVQMVIEQEVSKVEGQTSSTVGSNNSNPFNTVERKKVGIMLKVTPQINERNALQIVNEQELSKVEGQTSLDVVFGERKLKTTVLANDGELIVLGGLMDDQAGESVAKVPLLGDIPLIGNLFKAISH